MQSKSAESTYQNISSKIITMIPGKKPVSQMPSRLRRARGCQSRGSRERRRRTHTRHAIIWPYVLTAAEQMVTIVQETMIRAIHLDGVKYLRAI